ncbi:MAG: DUF3168 domain-containing protein [Methanomassiliicoccales archaeon]|jgi:hypothetical protein
MTYESAMSDLQAAVYAKITADTGTGGLLAAGAPMISGVFDEVPEGQAFPYITIGDNTELPWSTFGKDGNNEVLTLHIWSQAKGFREAELILKRLNVVLKGDLTISGNVHAGTNYEGADTSRDPDGITRQIIARYRVYVQES